MQQRARGAYITSICQPEATFDLFVAAQHQEPTKEDKLDLPPIPIIVCTDSYSLYECLVKLGTTKEKRLIVDIIALC